jgi:hypothetical protein
LYSETKKEEVKETESEKEQPKETKSEGGKKE